MATKSKKYAPEKYAKENIVGTLIQVRKQLHIGMPPPRY